MLVLLGLITIILIGLLSAGTGGASSSGMMSAADNGLFTASAVGRRIIAVNLADAGVEDAILWLTAQSAPPANTSAFAPSNTSFALPLWNASTQTGSPPRAVVDYPDANHTFSVTLYPNSGNAGSAQKSFLIESIGNYQGFTQVLHVYVSQTSFGHYVWFESNGGPGYWSSSFLHMDGPTHYNYMSGSYSLDWNDGTSPIFSYNGPDAFTVGFTLGWMHNYATVSSPPASTDTAGWNALSPYGPTSIKQNQNIIPFPSSASAVQQTAALGTLTTAPTSAIGATVCPGGGIYIHGNVQQMTLSATGTNNTTQVIEVYQIDPGNGNKDYTKITLDPSANQTTLQTGTFTTSGTITLTGSATTSGLTNGVVYCDAGIGTSTQFAEGGIKGVIADNYYSGTTESHANALTIATSPTKDIYFDGSIVTNTERQVQQNSSGQYEFHNSSGTIVTSSTSTTPSGCVPIYVPEASDTGQFLAKAGRLGLVMDNDVYGSYTFNSTGLSVTGYLTVLEQDCARFAYGTNHGESYCYAVPGLATMSMGSDVHQNGTYNWPSPIYGDNSYDNRLSDNPPPYYPTTSNRYTVVSWQRVTSCVQGS